MRLWLSIISFTLCIPLLSFAQNVEIPGTLTEAGEVTRDVGKNILQRLPDIIKNIWDTKVIPTWQKMLHWTIETLWGKSISPTVQKIVDKITKFAERQIEERKPMIEQELEKEKKEFQRDAWNRLKSLFE
ncbi:MAG: hypothetical protein AAB567_00685 [Patescibacteria group bacterium]